MIYHYTFTGEAPVVFPELTGIRKAQGLPAEITPGETIETDRPVLAKQLEPADEQTATATAHATDAEPELTAAEAAALGQPYEPADAESGTDDEPDAEPDHDDAETAPDAVALAVPPVDVVRSGRSGRKPKASGEPADGSADNPLIDDEIALDAHGVAREE